MRGKLERDKGQGGGRGLCSCFHLKLDSDHNVSSSLRSLLSLVPLEGFPLSPFEETTAPAGKNKGTLTFRRKHTHLYELNIGVYIYIYMVYSSGHAAC